MSMVTLQKNVSLKIHYEIQATIFEHLCNIVSVVDHRRTLRQAWHLVQATMQACSNSYLQ